MELEFLRMVSGTVLPEPFCLSSVVLRLRRPRIEVIRSSAAVIASNDVGERRGSDRRFKTGSLSLDGGEVGVWKVSPFFSRISDSTESVDRVGNSVFKMGRRRGCSRDGSGWAEAIIGGAASTQALAH